jgi:hypothetical protein
MVANILTPEQTAERVAKELDKLCRKYKCKVGVWLTWRELYHNFMIMQKTPEFDEAEFGLQIRLEDANTDKDKKGNKGAD